MFVRVKSEKRFGIPFGTCHACGVQGEVYTSTKIIKFYGRRALEWM